MRLKFSVTSLLPALVFLLLSPGMFVYFALNDFGLVSGLGGYFKISISTSLLILVFYAILRGQSSVKPHQFDFIFLLFIVLMAYIMFISGTMPNRLNVRASYLSVGIAWITLYFSIVIFQDTRSMRRIAGPSFLLVAVIVVFFSWERLSFSLGTTQQLNLDRDNPTYQFFAMFFVVASIVCAQTLSKRMVEAVLVSSLPLLLLIGSRTDLALMIATYFLTKVFSGMRLKHFLSALIAAGLFSAALEIVIKSELNRFAIFLVSGGQENLSEREMANARALDVISKNPFLGDPGNYEPGLYSHSILSVWVDFGLIGFAAYLSILLFFLWQAYRLRKVETHHGFKIGAFALAFQISILAALFVTKSGDYYLLPISFGLLRNVRALSQQRKCLVNHLAPQN